MEKLLSNSHEPYIIAELSGNHNGDKGRFLKLVREAAKSGANAIKLQTYTAEAMTVMSDEEPFQIKDKNSIWYGKTLFDLYSEGSTPRAWHSDIFSLCHSLGVECFSSPFSSDDVEFLERMGCPFYKLASPEITDFSLIEAIAGTKKPVIASNGMGKEGEVDEMVQNLKKYGVNDIILLECTSLYPAPIDCLNLTTIPYMKSKYGVRVGFSDHTLQSEAACVALSLGATVFEKHVTLSQNDGGIDSKFSQEPAQFYEYCQKLRNLHAVLSKKPFTRSAKENENRKYRRSLFASVDIQSGTKLEKRHITAKRPIVGIQANRIEEVIGKTLTRMLRKNDPIKYEDLV